MSTTTPNDSPTDVTTARLVTPPGQAGIAVVQITGRDALNIVRPSFESHRFSSDASPQEDRLYFGRFTDNEDTIDDVIAVCRKDDQTAWRIEINCHGGLRVTERILQTLAARGAKVVRDAQTVDPAWAGHSHFENQMLELATRMDTRRLAKWVLRQRDALPERIARMIDDIEHDGLDRAAAELDRLIADYPRTALLLRGVHIALVGPPNAGKSTLINALSGLEGSIVSERAGTTRDWVEHPSAIDGIPITFIDTAGITAPQNDIDRQAMTRANAQAEAADLRLLVLDQHADWPSAHLNEFSKVLLPPTIAVLNKADLPAAWPAEFLTRIAGVSTKSATRVSSLRKTGLDALVRAIQTALGLADFSDQSAALLTDQQLENARIARDTLHHGLDGACLCVRKLIS